MNKHGPPLLQTDNMAPSTDRNSGPIFQRLSDTTSYLYALHEYVRRFAWQWVQRMLIRPSPCRAHGWPRFWRRRTGAATGSTKSKATIMQPWLLEIDEHSMLSDGVTMYNINRRARGLPI